MTNPTQSPESSSQDGTIDDAHLDDVAGGRRVAPTGVKPGKARVVAIEPAGPAPVIGDAPAVYIPPVQTDKR